MTNLVKNDILGVGITNAKKEQVLEYLLEKIEKTKDKVSVVTPNPEMVVLAYKNSSFKALLNQADIALCDGTGLMWAGNVLGKPFSERVTGTDFLEYVCEEVVRKPITVGFLGGKNGVAAKTAECLIKKYPGLKVVFVAEEWSEEGFKMYDLSFKSENTKNDTSSMIHNRSIDILFVAYGFPKQEEWIAENLPKLPVRVAMGVGGAFDYISGNVARAPKWVQAIGFEWLFRLVVQPWRFKRQFALLQFVFLVLKEKLSKR